MANLITTVITSYSRYALVLAITGLSLAACVDREAAVARHVEKARSALDLRQYQKARVELRNAVRLDPTHVESILLLGRIAERNEAWRRAYSQYERALNTDRDSVPARTALAQLLLRFGDTERARSLVSEARELAPQDALAATLEALLSYRAGNLDAARKQVAFALELDPDLPIALSLMAEVLLKANEAQAAVDLLRGAVDRAPQNDVVIRLLARTLAGLGRWDEAIGWQQRAVALVPEQRDFRFTLAGLHLSAEQLQAATQVLADTYAAFEVEQTAQAVARVIVTEYPAEAAVRTLGAFVERHPATFAFSSGLAGIYERDKRWGDARRVLEAFLAVAEQSPQALDARVQLARQHMLSGDSSTARELLEGVLEANPKAVDALILRSQFHRQDQRPDRAVLDLQLALDAGEKVAPIKRLLGQAYAESGDLARAIEVLLEVLEGEPGDGELRLSLARLALRAGKLTLASDQLDDAVASGADAPDILELRFHLAERAGDLGRATELADALREQRPDDALGYYLAGRLEHRQGRFDEARTSYLAALDRSPAAPEVVDGLVRVMVATGAQDDAVALLRERLASNPDDVQATLLMADVQLYGDDSDAGAQSFEQLIDEHPGWWLPYARLAALHVRDRNLAAAREVLRKGLSATERNPLLGEQLAGVALAQGDLDAAIGVYEELIRAHPAVDRVANNLAMLLITHRDDRPSVQRALQLTEPLRSSSKAAYLDTAGWVRLQAGEVQLATELLQRAVRAAPGRPTQHYHLAVAYLHTGDEAAALRELELALASDQPFPERQRAQRAREELVTGVRGVG